VNARGRTQFAPTEKDREHEISLSFFTRLAAWYGVLHFFGVLSGTKIAFLREEGGRRQGFPEANEMSFGGSLRSVTEGARATLNLYGLYRNALPSPDFVGSSLPEGALDLCVPKVYLLFLTSTAFVDTKSEAPRKAGQD